MKDKEYISTLQAFSSEIEKEMLIKMNATLPKRIEEYLNQLSDSIKFGVENRNKYVSAESIINGNE